LAVLLATKLMALAIAARADAGVILKTWVGPPIGAWEAAEHWFPKGVPLDAPPLLYEVLIDSSRGQSSAVSLSGSYGIQSLEVTASDSLVITNGSQLRLAGDLCSNAGSITLASTGDVTALRVDAPQLMITGPGTLYATGAPANRIHGAVSSNRLVVDPACTISGALSLGLDQLRLTNEGVIESNLPGGAVVDLTDGPGSFNLGTMRSTNGATLAFVDTRIDNTGGMIEAAPGSLVTFSQSHIIGGTLRDTDGAKGAGALRNLSSLTLNGVSIDGALECENGSYTQLQGPIALAGSVVMRGSISNTELVIDTSSFVLAEGNRIVGAVPLGYFGWGASLIRGTHGLIRLVVSNGAVIEGSFRLGENQLVLSNDGLIVANIPTLSSIRLADAATNFNTGIIRASAGSTLGFSNTAIDNSGGVIEADAGSFVSMSNVMIAGGTLRDSDGLAGPGHIQANNFNLIEDATIEGELRASGGNTRLKGVFNVEGAISLNTSSSITPALRIDGATTLAGRGQTLALQDHRGLIYSSMTGMILTIAPEHTVRGSFTFGSSSSPINHLGIVNQGAIIAELDSATQIMASDTVGFVNEGLLHAAQASILVSAGAFTNSGTVRIEPAKTLQRTGMYVQTAGETRVDGTLIATTGVAIDGGTLTGSGLVASTVVCGAGTVAPGASTGILTIDGDSYTQHSTGSLSIEINGSSPGDPMGGYDRLTILGGANLAGNLTIMRAQDFIPLPGEQYTVLTCTGTLNGTFDSVTSCDDVLVTYHADRVDVEFLDRDDVVGDLNRDGFVDGSDLAILIGGWGPCVKGCCMADINGDGVVDGNDLAILLGHWNPPL